MTNIFDFLYTLIIFPLVQIIEMVFVLGIRAIDNVGVSVIGVSLAVTFLCLPLYIVAEKWQKTEREIIGRLKPKTDKIKAVFRGDEQYMILSTLYRQNHYHPLYALRNSFGILIQVPFFIAAYAYLSHLELLRGESFLFINDMSLPDGVIKIGAITINILPVLMTAINCLSGAVYTKGLPARDKIQIFGTSAVFLVLLYNSPSGLVLYWTMNNVFSLAKNIFYKLKNPLKVLFILVSLAVGAFILYLLFISGKSFKKRLVLVAVLSIVFFIPLFVKCVKFLQKKILGALYAKDRERHLLFLANCASLVFLTGLTIPSSIIASSPAEFSFIDNYSSPLVFLAVSFSKSCGFFAFWPLCVYFLFGRKIQTVLTAIFSFITLSALINAFVFQGNYGMISNVFGFDSTGVLSVPLPLALVNIFSLIPVFILLLLCFRKNAAGLFLKGNVIILAAVALLGVINVTRIGSSYAELVARENPGKSVHAITPIFRLSKASPNIVVVMADCAINGFVKPAFEEHPDLVRQFDGFVLYSNTVSFALHTLMGVPPIWGGYEYTPKEMNARKNQPLVEKHNEALLLLPRLLTGAGFEITVTDPSWANHEWVPDTSIYRNYDNVTAFNTKGKYSYLWYSRNDFGNTQVTSTRIIRNAFWFSLLKITPMPLRSVIYNDGWYWSTEDFGESVTEFIDCYAVLDFLPELTLYDDGIPSGLLITNDATHEPRFLQAPDYVPVEQVTDRGNGIYANVRAFHANSAFYLRFGEWLDALRENGVYDNTRIIIVSDHGAGVNANLPGGDISIPGERRENYNPLLLVKDFNAQGPLQTSMEFMTNADVPVIALEGIVEDPVNPFTGERITGVTKKTGAWISISHVPLAHQHGRYQYRIKPDQWLFVHDSIFDPANWEKRELP